VRTRIPVTPGSEPFWPILDRFTPENYSPVVMAHQQTDTLSLLSVELTKRLKQLGYSRREFERRSGLSRQTLFKIEHEGHTDLRDDTYRTLDEHLKWVPGTALALSQGEVKAVEQADALTLADRESAYRWRIVEKIQSMSLGELETMVAIMEERTLGEVAMSTARHIELMEQRISALED
jgi:transcriptional regulator with XRE-family HTH domain